MQAVNRLENLDFFKYHLFDNNYHMDTLNCTISWDPGFITDRSHRRITIMKHSTYFKQAVNKLKHLI